MFKSLKNSSDYDNGIISSQRDICKEEFDAYLNKEGMSVSDSVFTEALEQVQKSHPSNIKNKDVADLEKKHASKISGPNSINIEKKLHDRNATELKYIMEHLNLTSSDISRPTLIRTIKTELLKY